MLPIELDRRYTTDRTHSIHPFSSGTFWLVVVVVVVVVYSNDFGQHHRYVLAVRPLVILCRSMSLYSHELHACFRELRSVKVFIL
jgi:hypothetical protein